MQVSEIKQFLSENQTWAKKSYGQHFLIDENVLDKIVATAEIKSSDRILEIGPGLGVLTDQLIERADEVVAIEADNFLAEILKKKFQIPVCHSRLSHCHPCEGRDLMLKTGSGGNPLINRVDSRLRGNDKEAEGNDKEAEGNDKERGGNDRVKSGMTDNNGTMKQCNNLTLIEGDALKVIDSLEFKKSFRSKRYKVVANIPYSITSKLLRLLLEEYQPTSITFLVQKEVAERVCAQVGNMSMLSLSVQYFGQPKIIATVPAGAFWPPPKVESAILYIVCHSREGGNPLTVDGVDSRLRGNDKTLDLFKLARIGFSSKRKMLVHNLTVGLGLPRAKITDIIKQVGLKETVRAQELSVSGWQALLNLI